MKDIIISYEKEIALILPILTFLITALYVIFTYKLLHNPYNTFLELETSSNDLSIKNTGSFAIRIEDVSYYARTQNFSVKLKNSLLYKKYSLSSYVLKNDESIELKMKENLYLNNPIFIKYRLLSGKKIFKKYKFDINAALFREAHKVELLEFYSKYLFMILFEYYDYIVGRKSRIIKLSIIYILLKKVNYKDHSEISDYLKISDDETEKHFDKLNKVGYLNGFKVTEKGLRFYQKKSKKYNLIGLCIRKEFEKVN